MTKKNTNKKIKNFKALCGAFSLSLILMSKPLNADEGLNFSCLNILSMLGKKYEPLLFKLEVTGFHYFDKRNNKFKIITSKELEFGEDRFTVRFPEYELGFQKIVFAGETEPTITMSKYDYINNKFLDHYECRVVKSYIN
tara:strand:+ start:1741 stop:2160 length:420 start_codon:yes stop_codon:yes gene_type:complete